MVVEWSKTLVLQIQVASGHEGPRFESRWGHISMMVKITHENLSNYIPALSCSIHLTWNKSRLNNNKFTQKV